MDLAIQGAARYLTLHEHFPIKFILCLSQFIEASERRKSIYLFLENSLSQCILNLLLGEVKLNLNVKSMKLTYFPWFSISGLLTLAIDVSRLGLFHNLTTKNGEQKLKEWR